MTLEGDILSDVAPQVEVVQYDGKSNRLVIEFKGATTEHLRRVRSWLSHSTMFTNVSKIKGTVQIELREALKIDEVIDFIFSTINKALSTMNTHTVGVHPRKPEVNLLVASGRSTRTQRVSAKELNGYHYRPPRISRKS